MAGPDIPANRHRPQPAQLARSKPAGLRRQVLRLASGWRDRVAGIPGIGSPEEIGRAGGTGVGGIRDRYEGFAGCPKHGCLKASREEGAGWLFPARSSRSVEFSKTDRRAKHHNNSTSSVRTIITPADGVLKHTHLDWIVKAVRRVVAVVIMRIGASVNNCFVYGVYLGR